MNVAIPKEKLWNMAIFGARWDGTTCQARAAERIEHPVHVEHEQRGTSRLHR
jgi:hypothetical protein